jgi:cation diffusion facilitator family transporter
MVTTEPPPGMSDAQRSRAVRRVLVIEALLNLLVAGAKGVYGVMSGSLAVATDAVHSLLDAGNNVVGVVATRAAAAPPDRGHPYGHRKIEIVAAAGIGVLIALGAARFGWEAIEALIRGRDPVDTSAVGFAIIIGAWAINIFVAIWEARKARELDSAYLAADAKHTASDVLVTAAVLGAFTAAHFGVHWADPVGAILVLLVIARVAWQVLSANVTVLVDGAVVDPDRVIAIALGVSGVRGCHRVRSRGTEHAAHLDLHLLLQGDLPLRRAHDLAHQVEDAVKKALPHVVDVTVHMEPEEDGYEGL